MVERGYCIYSISLNILTYFLPLNNYLVTLFHNTICRAQLFCRFLLSASEYLSNMLFSYHLLYFCTALSLIIMLSSHYHHHKSKTFSQLSQCPFTGTLLLLIAVSIKINNCRFKVALRMKQTSYWQANTFYNEGL